MNFANTGKCIWISALLTTVLCTTALAQPRTLQSPASGTFGPQIGDWELTLGGSGASAHDFKGGRGEVAGSLGYYLTPHWQVSVRQGIGFSDVFENSSWSGATRLALDYHFDLDRWRPFVGVNFGGIYGDGVTDTFASGLEAGIKYYVQPRTFIMGMLEWQWLFKSARDAGDAFDDGQFIYTLAIGFNF
jgi:hypothetical protein